MPAARSWRPSKQQTRRWRGCLGARVYVRFQRCLILPWCQLLSGAWLRVAFYPYNYWINHKMYLNLVELLISDKFYVYIRWGFVSKLDYRWITCSGNAPDDIMIATCRHSYASARWFIGTCNTFYRACQAWPIKCGHQLPLAPLMPIRSLDKNISYTIGNNNRT